MGSELPALTPSLSLVHASARPNGWRSAVERWLDTCEHPERVEHVLVFDDPVKVEPVFYNTTVAVNPGVRSAVAAYNLAAQLSVGKLLVMIADDAWPVVEYWDRLMLEAIPDLNGEYVLDTDNQDGSDLLAFSILTRSYYKRLGWMFCPEYDGVWADYEMTVVSRRDGVVIPAKHIKLHHHNPDRDGGWDDVYRMHRSPDRTKLGQEVFLRRMKEGFPNANDSLKIST